MTGTWIWGPEMGPTAEPLTSLAGLSLGSSAAGSRRWYVSHASIKIQELPRLNCVFVACFHMAFTLFHQRKPHVLALSFRGNQRAEQRQTIATLIFLPSHLQRQTSPTYCSCWGKCVSSTWGPLQDSLIFLAKLMLSIFPHSYHVRCPQAPLILYDLKAY